MQTDAARHSRCKRMHRLIAVQNIAPMRAAEQCEHGKVGFPVSTVRGGVDEHRAVFGPHDISAPEVAVQPGRSFAGIEFACRTALHDSVYCRATVGGQAWSSEL